MARLFFLPWIFCVLLSIRSGAQTLFVDAVKGSDTSAGTLQAPLSTLDKAVAMAGGFTGRQSVTIKLAPGLYTLTRQLLLSSFLNEPDTIRYSVEAAILPDDTGWLPSKMPVIQSISANNKNYGHFDHCIGIQVERNNTSFRGLKFVGNADPSVSYYYAIERHRPELKNMDISQCYFIGDKNSAPMQGAVFAQGSGIRVDHCIFYGCKNALLLFVSVTGFSLTHSIIYGAYEGAIWFGKYSDFVFSDNIIANNNCFWVGWKDYTPHYVFTNSLITGNKIYMGLNNKGGIEKDSKYMPIEKGIRKSGPVLLKESDTETTPKDHLHLLPTSAGRDIPAGIFGLNAR